MGRFLLRQFQVIEGIELVKTYRDSSKKQYSDEDHVPIKGVVKNEWMSFVLQGSGINRANYELALLDSLRNRLRCKEIWVTGSYKYCNPDEDLPQDFNKKKVEYFDKLKADMNPNTFTQNLKNRMRTALESPDKTMPQNSDVKILNKKGGWIAVSPLVAQEEPQNLLNLKKEIMGNWPMTNLLDILKETELRVGFTQKFETVGVRESMSKDDLQRRICSPCTALEPIWVLKESVRQHLKRIFKICHTLSSDGIESTTKRGVDDHNKNIHQWRQFLTRI